VEHETRFELATLTLATLSRFPESLCVSGICELLGHATLRVGARWCAWVCSEFGELLTRFGESEGRAVESRSSSDAKVVGLPRVGGLHHRYAWKEAAWDSTLRSRWAFGPIMRTDSLIFLLS